MREIDLVLDFAVNLGDRMLDSGANLERVNMSIHRILHTYGFQEISLFFPQQYPDGQCLGFILASTVSFYIRKSQSSLGSMKSRLTEPNNKTVRSKK